MGSSVSHELDISFTKNNQLNDHYRYNSILIATQGLECFKKNRIEKSFDYFELALSRSPEIPDIQLMKGQVQLGMNQNNEAILSLEKATQLQLIPTEATYYLAICYFKKREFMSSMQCIDKYLDRQPNKTKAFFWKGRICSTLNMHEQAVNYFKKCFKHKPQIPFSHFFMGKSLSEVGKIGEAQNQFYQSQLMHHNSLECLKLMGECKQKLSVQKDAIKWFDIYHSKNPNDEFVNNRRQEINIILEQQIE